MLVQKLKNRIESLDKVSYYGLIGLVISIAVTIIMKLFIELFFFLDINSELGEKFYGYCYIIGFIGIYGVLLSSLVLLFNFIRLKFKSCTPPG
jgi:hypothetical protein